jgi:hypothetical protein
MRIFEIRSKILMLSLLKNYINYNFEKSTTLNTSIYATFSDYLSSVRMTFRISINQQSSLFLPPKWPVLSNETVEKAWKTSRVEMRTESASD